MIEVFEPVEVGRQMAGIDFQPIRVDTASVDEDGRLILWRGRLIGVLVRLEGEEQGHLKGHWSLEAAFGPLDGRRPEPFIDLHAARAWAEATVREALGNRQTIRR